MKKQIHGAREKRDRNLSIAFLIPSFILIGFVNIYPVITGVSYSLRDGSVIKPGSFVGLENYAEVLTNARFWNAMKFSVIFSLATIVGSYLIGLALALILNKDIPGRGFFRAALIIPWVIPSVVSISAWRWLINDQTSLINVLLGYIGIKPVLFLADPAWARFTVCMIKIWISYPFVMISLLASLQSISPDMYESARLDTSSGRKVFFHITLPYLKPTSVILVILLTVWSFNDFGLIYLLTGGGPNMATENMVYLAYLYPFTYNKIGPGSAIAVITLLLLMILSYIMMKLRRSEEV